MFCPKCGNSIPEGASFCAQCGHQIPQNIRQQYDNVSQPASQPNPQPGYQGYQAGPQQGYQPYQGYQAGPQQVYQPYQGYQTGPQVVASAVKEPCFRMGSKIAIIIMAALALTFGVIAALLYELPTGTIIEYYLMPEVLMVTAAILMNKVPPVVAIAPIGYDFVIRTIDFINEWEWYSEGETALYITYGVFTLLFLFELLTRKTVFKVFCIIIAFLLLFHDVGHWLIWFIEELFWFSSEQLAAEILYINYAVFADVAILLLVYAMKRKKNQ